MRQRIFEDDKGNLCGEYPHDPAVGFERGKRGLRRRLVPAAERDRLSDDAAMRLALQRYADTENQIRDKQFANAAKQRATDARRRVMMISAAAAEWLSAIGGLSSDKTLAMYRQTLALYVDLVSDHRVNDFSRDHNLRFVTALTGVRSTRPPHAPIAATTQNMHVRHLGVFLRWCFDAELLDRLPRLKKPRPPKKEMETFSLDQLAVLKQFLADNRDQALSRAAMPDAGNRAARELVNANNLLRAFFLATNALLRMGAIAYLPLAAIDLDAGLVRVRDVPERNWKNKGSKWPNKPINAQLAEFLAADLAARHPSERWFLDDGRGNPWYADKTHVSKAMGKACRLAGLPDGVKPFHWGMRAALITWLLNNGTPPQKVQQLADHSSIQTTMSYYNTRAASQRDAVDRLPVF